MSEARSWWVYMIVCRGGGIYVGMALDVEARYRKHAAGRGSAYTRMNPPVRLLAKWAYPDRRSAAQAERALKRLKAVEKWRLVTYGDIPLRDGSAFLLFPSAPDRTKIGP